MAYTIINKSSEHFNTKLYTGNGGTQSIDVGFQSDWTWLKSRTEAKNHVLIDAVRGSSKNIHSNLTNAEDTNATRITGFDSDGFNLGSSTTTNTNSQNYVSWNWKANGTGSANTAGSINSTVSANTTSGFSIVSWSGTGVNATIGHGLGTPPAMIIVKERNGTSSWITWQKGLSSYKHFLLLNTTAAETNSYNNFQNVAPTNTVFSIGTEVGTNRNTGTYIAYCFADVQGYSKVGGSYTGNGNADGTFVYTGFKPAFIMTKNSGYTGNWVMKDNKRSGTSALQNFGQMNPNQTENPSANLNNAENKSSGFAVDILSNGFKMRGVDNAGSNWDGNNYIYMAFAEAPLVGTNNVPCTAR